MAADTTARANDAAQRSSEYAQFPSAESHTPALHNKVVAVTPLVSIIQDISRYHHHQPPIDSSWLNAIRCQCQLSRTQQDLEYTKEKLKKFEELAESLRSSMTLSTVVAPVLENIQKEHRFLEVKIEQDIRKLTQAWDEALNVFIRVIYQRFDKEMEDNKESLHQEARILFNTLSEKYLTPYSVFSSESNYPLKYPRDTVASRKRPRVDSDHDTDDTSQFAKTISRMQAQLDRQSEKIDFLLHQN